MCFQSFRTAEMELAYLLISWGGGEVETSGPSMVRWDLPVPRQVVFGSTVGTLGTPHPMPRSLCL